MAGLKPQLQDELSMSDLTKVDSAYRLALKAEEKLKRQGTRRLYSTSSQGSFKTQSSSFSNKTSQGSDTKGKGLLGATPSTVTFTFSNVV